MSALAVVIGVGPGIGEALAREFGRQGFTLALVTRNAEKLKSLRATLREQGFEAHVFNADASNHQNLRATLETIQTLLGVPDVLVYNVMANGAGTAPTTLDPERAVTDFRGNVLGALVAAQTFASGMVARGSGSVFFTGGGLAIKPLKDYASLALGKAGIRNLAFSLAQELQPHVHVATVTVAGVVRPNSSFAPEKIAAHFWRLHQQPKDAWEIEHVFVGER